MVKEGFVPLKESQAAAELKSKSKRTHPSHEGGSWTRGT